jgi:poly(3-hydroxybutyrate) depolymerase
MCLGLMGVADDGLAQRGVPPFGGAGPRGRGDRAGGGGSVAGVQQRTYRFPGTNEKIEYDVFVSHKVDKKKPSPLVIGLHGMNVPPMGLMRFLTESADKNGYIVATPTGYNLQGWYGANGPSSSSTSLENLGELSEKDVMNVLDLMRREFNIDDHRIYLLGQSMGGGGAMHLAVKYSDVWAAVGLSAPAMSIQQPEMLESIKAMPVIVVHGSADDRVPVTRILPWVDKMRELKMTYEYEEMPGVGHPDAIEHGASSIFAFFGKYSKPVSGN